MSAAHKALQRVRALHSPKRWSALALGCPHRDSDEYPDVQHEELCFEEIETCVADGTAWPCSTIRVIDGDRQ